eukprot:2203531-Amphidinium_carterae.1
MPSGPDVAPQLVPGPGGLTMTPFPIELELWTCPQPLSKKKKDHHSSTDSSDSSKKNKKKKRKKSSKKKKTKKSLSRDRKVKKKGSKSWGAPDDGKHPWDRREEDKPSRIPGPSFIPEEVRIEMLQQIRSFWHEGLLMSADDIPNLLDFYDDHGTDNYSRYKASTEMA